MGPITERTLLVILFLSQFFKTLTNMTVYIDIHSQQNKF